MHIFERLQAQADSRRVMREKFARLKQVVPGELKVLVANPVPNVVPNVVPDWHMPGVQLRAQPRKGKFAPWFEQQSVLEAQKARAEAYEAAIYGHQHIPSYGRLSYDEIDWATDLRLAGIGSVSHEELERMFWDYRKPKPVVMPVDPSKFDMQDWTEMAALWRQQYPDVEFRETVNVFKFSPTFESHKVATEHFTKALRKYRSPKSNTVLYVLATFNGAQFFNQAITADGQRRRSEGLTEIATACGFKTNVATYNMHPLYDLYAEANPDMVEPLADWERELLGGYPENLVE